MFSKIIKNGTVVDGTGKKSFRADIAIEKDKIVQVGNLKGAKAADVIDAQGKFVTPGFVDIQNHSDVYWCLFDNPNLDALISQGITTALVGNCGASLAPLLSRDALLSIRKWHSIEAINFNWISFAEYLDELSKKNYGLNIASLVGYSTLRRGLIGDEFRKLKEKADQTTIVKEETKKKKQSSEGDDDDDEELEEDEDGNVSRSDEELQLDDEVDDTYGEKPDGYTPNIKIEEKLEKEDEWPF